MGAIKNSPYLVGAFGMLAAVGGFGLSYYGGIKPALIAGPVAGVVLGVVGVVLAKQTGRSARFPINAIVMGVVFLVGGQALEGLSHNSPPGPSLGEQIVRAESKLSFAVIDRDSAQRMVDELIKKRDANRLKPELLDKIRLIEVRPYFVDKRVPSRPDTVYRRQHIDYVFENQTGLDLEYIWFALSRKTPEKPDAEDIQSGFRDWGGGVDLPAGGTGVLTSEAGTSSTLSEAEAEAQQAPSAEDLNVQIQMIAAGRLEDVTRKVPLIHRGLEHYQQKRLDERRAKLGAAQARVDEARRELEALK